MRVLQRMRWGVRRGVGWASMRVCQRLKNKDLTINFNENPYLSALFYVCIVTTCVFRFLGFFAPRQAIDL